jgi:uncharacterized protein
MTQPAWRQSVIDYFRAETQPIDKFGHMPRLYALACQIARGLEADDDVLFAAAWMHDLGVFIGHRPEDPEALKAWNHVPYTIAQARVLLPGWGFPPAKLDAVAEVIRTHQPHDEPILIEAVILRDADILEQLGAIGALRALAKIGRDTRFPTYSSVLPVLRKAVDTLPAMLRLDTSRALAAQRVEVLSLFIAAIDIEAGVLLH